MAKVLLQNGKTLEIRPVRSEDAAEMLAYAAAVGGESDNLLFGAEGVGMTLDQEREFLGKINASANAIMMIGRIDGEIVASCNVSSALRERIRHVGLFALAVRQSHWNTGVGSAMAQAIIEWARQTGILTVLHLTVRVDNVYAIRLYEHVGFCPVGVLHHDLRVGGRYVDTLFMELLFE